MNNPPTSLPQDSGLESFLTNPRSWLKWLPLDSQSQINRLLCLLSVGVEEPRKEGTPESHSFFTCPSDMSYVN